MADLSKSEKGHSNGLSDSSDDNVIPTNHKLESYDSLPDPDEGKSEEERAQLVSTPYDPRSP